MEIQEQQTSQSSTNEPEIAKQKRQYEIIWDRILEKTEEKIGSRVSLTVRNAASFKRIRKAVWKEKSLDTRLAKGETKLTNRDKYRLKCDILAKDGRMEFWCELSTTEENI